LNWRERREAGEKLRQALIQHYNHLSSQQVVVDDDHHQSIAQKLPIDKEAMSALRETTPIVLDNQQEIDNCDDQSLHHLLQSVLHRTSQCLLPCSASTAR